jgi:hypothetical protein
MTWWRAPAITALEFPQVPDRPQRQSGRYPPAISSPIAAQLWRAGSCSRISPPRKRLNAARVALAWNRARCACKQGPCERPRILAPLRHAIAARCARASHRARRRKGAALPALRTADGLVQNTIAEFGTHRASRTTSRARTCRGQSEISRRRRRRSISAGFRATSAQHSSRARSPGRLECGFRIIRKATRTPP